MQWCPTWCFFFACPRGANHAPPNRLPQIQRSDFSLAKIQAIVKGASGWALVPFILFFGYGAAFQLLSERAACDMACAAGSVAVVAVFGRGHLYLEWLVGC